MELLTGQMRKARNSVQNQRMRASSATGPIRLNIPEWSPRQEGMASHLGARGLCFVRRFLRSFARSVCRYRHTLPHSATCLVFVVACFRLSAIAGIWQFSSTSRPMVIATRRAVWRRTRFRMATDRLHSRRVRINGGISWRSPHFAATWLIGDIYQEISLRPATRGSMRLEND